MLPRTKLNWLLFSPKDFCIAFLINIWDGVTLPDRHSCANTCLKCATVLWRLGWDVCVSLKKWANLLFSFSHSGRENLVKQRPGELLWCTLSSPLSSAGAPGTRNDDYFLHACMNLVQIFPQRCPASLFHYTSHMPVPSAHHSTLPSPSSSLHHLELPQQIKWKLFMRWTNPTFS